MIMDGVDIRQGLTGDVATIRQLAITCWWPTYSGYLPHDQIRLMLERMFAEKVLLQQLAAGHQYMLAYRMATPVGFISYRHKDGREGEIVRIEKLYVLPDEQGRGIGRALMAEAEKYAHFCAANSLELHVNRSNPAKYFYEKQGFFVVEAVDIPYHGYVLDDYVMRKPIQQ